MKIIMVNPAMRPVCGRTAMVRHLSNTLHASGHEVTLLTGDDSDRSFLDDLPFKVRYTRMDPDKKSPGAILDLRNGLTSVVSEVQPDIVHTHHRYPAYIAKFASLGGAQHVTTVHSFLAGKRGFRLTPDIWVAVSSSVRAWLRDKYHINASRIEVIRNGTEIVPERMDLRESFERDGPSVLAAGRFAPEKGFDVLIEAWNNFSTNTPKAMLVIAGAGPEEARLREKAEAGNGRIEILNGAGQMEKLYQEANIVIVPSRSEPLSYVVLEAGMRGIPLIVTESGGPSELVANKQTGLVVPPGNVQALTEALHNAVHEYDAMLTAAKRLRAELVNRNSINTMTDAYIRLYKRISNKGNSSKAEDTIQ